MPGWLSQLSSYPRLRSRPRGSGIESQVWLPAQSGVCFSLAAPPTLLMHAGMHALSSLLSQINKNPQEEKKMYSNLLQVQLCNFYNITLLPVPQQENKFHTFLREVFGRLDEKFHVKVTNNEHSFFNNF